MRNTSSKRGLSPTNGGFTQMRAIIAAGSGLIGQALTASLAADGWEVIVLSRFPDAEQALRDILR
jgi:nucleoside-diphosphate-sugar epimerase